jgi:hypothetical protein
MPECCRGGFHAKSDTLYKVGQPLLLLSSSRKWMSWIQTRDKLPPGGHVTRTVARYVWAERPSGESREEWPESHAVSPLLLFHLTSNIRKQVVKYSPADWQCLTSTLIAPVSRSSIYLAFCLEWHVSKTKDSHGTTALTQTRKVNLHFGLSPSCYEHVPFDWDEVHKNVALQAPFQSFKWSVFSHQNSVRISSSLNPVSRPASCFHYFATPETQSTHVLSEVTEFLRI